MHVVLQGNSTHNHGLSSKYILKETVDGLFNTEAVVFF